MENIDTLIINRLGEHQRKVDFISHNLKIKKINHFTLRKISYFSVSIAACIAIIFAVSPLFKSNSLSGIKISAPTFTEFRGDGFEEIESLIKHGSFIKALSLVDAELNKNAVEIENIKSADISDEELEYTLALYNNGKEELLWSKIYLLVKLEKEKDLELCCKNYLNNSSFLMHRDKVEEIYKKIK